MTFSNSLHLFLYQNAIFFCQIHGLVLIRCCIWVKISFLFSELWVSVQITAAGSEKLQASSSSSRILRMSCFPDLLLFSCLCVEVLQFGNNCTCEALSPNICQIYMGQPVRHHPALSPEPPQLQLWRTAVRQDVSNMKLDLGRDQKLVGQQLQFPDPAPLLQLDGDVLRKGAQPAKHGSHSDLISTKSKHKWTQLYHGLCFPSTGQRVVPAGPPAPDCGCMNQQLFGAEMIFMTGGADHRELYLLLHSSDGTPGEKEHFSKENLTEMKTGATKMMVYRSKPF